MNTKQNSARRNTLKKIQRSRMEDTNLSFSERSEEVQTYFKQNKISKLQDIAFPPLIGRPTFNSTKRNKPVFSISKTNKEIKTYDNELCVLENFGKHSPDVGTYNIINSPSGPEYSVSKSIKFQEPKHRTDLSSNLPISYLKDQNFREKRPQNYSISTFPKQNRFIERELAQKAHLASSTSPATYWAWLLEENLKNVLFGILCWKGITYRTTIR
ncbi:unnamed protein product [Moneuplotes crassus]|uniref:Uncharacterized protein n=1 Tax=Euplotes crassus TaxID=5936 RepID=A0AAD1UG90_EUPCR|nr:unnamed protein product [Moneuplotes crassus]